MGRLTSVNAGARQGPLDGLPRAKPPNLKAAENALLVRLIGHRLGACHYEKIDDRGQGTNIDPANRHEFSS